MSSLFDIGKSAVQSYRQALAVTGQNIAIDGGLSLVNPESIARRLSDLQH